MTVKFVGLDDLLDNLNKFEIDLDDVIDDAVRTVAIKVQQGAIKAIRTPSIGTHVTRYTEGGKPKPHVASKPGDAPNSDTGVLMGSVSLDHVKGKQIAFVSTPFEYGFFLETVMNRPWLLPSLNEQIPYAENIIRRMVSDRIKAASNK